MAIVPEQVWLPRCIEFAKFEARRGITTQLKQSPARLTDKTGSPPLQETPTPKEWIKWIAASFTSGLNWMDFHIYINRL